MLHCATPPRQQSGYVAGDDGSAVPSEATKNLSIDLCAGDPASNQALCAGRVSSTCPYLPPPSRGAPGTLVGVECGAMPHTQPTAIASACGSACDLLLNTPSVTSAGLLRRSSWPDAPSIPGVSPASGADTPAHSASASAHPQPATAAATAAATATGASPLLAAAAALTLAAPGALSSGGQQEGLLVETGSAAYGQCTVTLHGMGTLSLTGVMSPSAAAAARGSAGGGSGTVHHGSFASSSFALLSFQPGQCADGGGTAGGGGGGVPAAATAADAPASPDCTADNEYSAAAAAGPHSLASTCMASSTPLQPCTPSPHDHAPPHNSQQQQQQPAPISSPPAPGGIGHHRLSAPDASLVYTQRAQQMLLLAAQAAQLLQPCDEPDLPPADWRLQPVQQQQPQPQARPMRSVAEMEAALAQSRPRAQPGRAAPDRCDSNGILICGGGGSGLPHKTQHRAPGRVDSNGILICGGGAAAASFFGAQSSRASSLLSDEATPPLFAHQPAITAAASSATFAYRRRRGQGQEIGYSEPPAEQAAAVDMGAFSLGSSARLMPPPQQQQLQLWMMESPFHAAATAGEAADPATAALGSSAGSGPSSAHGGNNGPRKAAARQRRPGSGAGGAMAALHRRYAMTPEAAVQASDSVFPNQWLTQSMEQKQQQAGSKAVFDARCPVSDSSSRTSDSAAVTAAAAAFASAAAAVGGGGRLLAGPSAQIVQALAALRQRAASDAAGSDAAAAVVAAAAVAALAASTGGSAGGRGGSLDELRHRIAAYQEQGLTHVNSSSLLHQLSTGLGLSVGRWADADGASETDGAAAPKRACDYGYAANAMAPPQRTRDGGAAAAAALAAALVAALGQSRQHPTLTPRGQRPCDGGGGPCGPGGAAPQALLAPLPPDSGPPQCFRAASLCASSILDGPLAAGFTALIDQLLAVAPDNQTVPLDGAGGFTVAVSADGSGDAAAAARAVAVPVEVAARAEAVPTAGPDYRKASGVSSRSGSGSCKASGGGSSSICTSSGGGNGSRGPGKRKASFLSHLLVGCFGRAAQAE
ncbi:hypothetical protein HYH02_001092 [Chlamydomonas schloesseri]|uniref:Uncharacterized protein n=1 Tax=Chlamydomonas schloesseri TaxID=2026947 RepID=A0A835WWU2_9CHLO|nr:hypothetical protein HYH02_001092 [Chlamydomonas schloesseri]|eukprot:KAG2454051.1 hypothetical protein HYH02_001092 [Chlamydomonas schloesseri]